VPAHRRLVLLCAGAALAVAACGGDTAAMVDPGGPPVTADAGDLRVLRHRDDPTAGDEWITVLEAHPEVFERTGAFREEGSRTAEDDEPADQRLLYEARGSGRTLLVRLDCRRCGADGVPSTPVEETELLVWTLVSGSGGGPTRLGPSALVPGEDAEVEVGDHVVVVEPDDRLDRQPLLGGEVLRLVATHDAPRIDVYAVVAPGRGAAVYGGGAEVTYPVVATAPG